jgi:hypothetical protein
MKEVLVFLESHPSITMGIIALLITSGYSSSTKKRENDKMMKDLFTDFNKRYSALNGDLEKASKAQTVEDLSPSLRDAVIDFFNLCAEEYFWKKKGRIDDSIWNSWEVGMNYWYNHPSEIIKNLWLSETVEKKGLKSYYIQRGDEFFKDDNS